MCTECRIIRDARLNMERFFRRSLRACIGALIVTVFATIVFAVWFAFSIRSAIQSADSQWLQHAMSFLQFLTSAAATAGAWKLVDLVNRNWEKQLREVERLEMQKHSSCEAEGD